MSIRLRRSFLARVRRVMAEAAKMVEDLGYDAVDINLGCPAKKVVKCGGSGLLRDLRCWENIFRAVRAAVRIPLTIKLRAGWDEKIRRGRRSGEDGGRHRRRRRGRAFPTHAGNRATPGAADWSLIAAVKQAGEKFL